MEADCQEVIFHDDQSTAKIPNAPIMFVRINTCDRALGISAVAAVGHLSCDMDFILTLDMTGDMDMSPFIFQSKPNHDR